MSAPNDAGPESVTVTCQASLQELRSAALWLYLHDRAAQIGILLVIAGAVGIFILFGRIAANASALAEHPSWILGRGVVSLIWLAFFVTYKAWMLWTLPARAWSRLQVEGPTTLTVSSMGLSWHNSVRRGESSWNDYVGYAELSDVLIFVSSQPFVVPRSTVSAVDLARVLAIAGRYLQPVSQFDSRKRRVSVASPA